MNVEITPEPSPEERAAILAAVEQLLAEEAREPDAWWQAGVRENLEPEEEA